MSAESANQSKATEHWFNDEKLDEDLRAELPLKRIWTVATEDGEE